MRIGIIIPYYENQRIMRDKLEWLLEILKEQLDSETTIVIVDDGSKAYWLDEYNDICVIHNKQNGGVSRARNIGLDYLDMLDIDYVGFIDGDDSVSSDYIKQARKLMLLGYDFIDSRFVQEGLEIFGSVKGNNTLKEIIRGGVAGTFIKKEIIGNARFDEKLQIGEDIKFVSEVIDLKKHKKGVSKGIYVYNLGVNSDSLTMKHSRGEIGIEFTQDFLTKEYYANQDSVDNGDKVLEYTFEKLNEEGITLNKCFDFADKMGLIVDMPSVGVVVFKKNLAKKED